MGRGRQRRTVRRVEYVEYRADVLVQELGVCGGEAAASGASGVRGVLRNAGVLQKPGVDRKPAADRVGALRPGAPGKRRPSPMVAMSFMAACLRSRWRVAPAVCGTVALHRARGRRGAVDPASRYLTGAAVASWRWAAIMATSSAMSRIPLGSVVGVEAPVTPA